MSADGAYEVDVPDDRMDLRVMLKRLAAHWWWVASSVVFFTAAFIAVAYLLTPIYRAQVILIPAKGEKDSNAGGGEFGGIGAVASLAGIDLANGDSLAQEAMAVLKSRQFTDKFILDRHLMPVLFEKQWDATTGKWKVDADHQPTLSRAYRKFKNIRSLVQDKKTPMVTLDVDWSDRFAAADWANDLVTRLNLEMRQRAMARAESAVGYLEKEFEATTAVATREAIGRLIEQQVKQRMLAEVTKEFAFRVIDPATIADRDDRYFPNRLVLAAAGPLVGLIFGVIFVLGYYALKDPEDRDLNAP